MRAAEADLPPIPLWGSPALLFTCSPALCRFQPAVLPARKSLTGSGTSGSVERAWCLVVQWNGGLVRSQSDSPTAEIPIESGCHLLMSGGLVGSRGTSLTSPLRLSIHDGRRMEHPKEINDALEAETLCEYRGIAGGDHGRHIRMDHSRL